MIGKMTNYFYLFIVVVIDFQFYQRRNSDIFQVRQTVGELGRPGERLGLKSGEREETQHV